MLLLLSHLLLHPPFQLVLLPRLPSPPSSIPCEDNVLTLTRYMFFVTPSDLTNLDIASGHCYNTSVPQNLTFSEQGLPLDLSSTTSVNGSANHTAGAGRLLAAGGDSWGIIGGWGNAAVTVAMLGAFWGLL